MRKIINDATFCVKDGKISVNPLRYMDNARTLSTDHGISFKDEIIGLIRAGKDEAEIRGYIELALRSTRQDRAAAMGPVAFDKWIKAMIGRHMAEAMKKLQRQDGVGPAPAARATIRRASSKFASLEEIAGAIATYLRDVPEDMLETITLQDIGIAGKEIRESDFACVLNVLYVARRFA